MTGKRNMVDAILKTPMHRRRQTMAVAAWFYCPLVSIIVMVVMAVWYFKWTWPVLFLYYTWFVYTLRWPFEGRPVPQLLATMFKRTPLFRHFSPYFPVTVTFDKDAERCFTDTNTTMQYMFGYHPHGIFGLGAVAAFAMSRPVQLSMLRVRLLTVDVNFYIPIWRDLLMAMGLAGVGRESLQRLLQSGQSVVIVIGGAREALEARPNRYELVLRKRRGFFREALRRGCPVVPVFGFGETDLYTNTHNRDGWLRRLQDRLIHLFGFTLPLFNGRGMFNYERGVLPRRVPINVVIGEPIPSAISGTSDGDSDSGTSASGEPTEEDITRLQDVYIARLQQLYDTYKTRFHGDDAPPLNIIL